MTKEKMPTSVKKIIDSAKDCIRMINETPNPTPERLELRRRYEEYIKKQYTTWEG